MAKAIGKTRPAISHIESGRVADHRRRRSVRDFRREGARPLRLAIQLVDAGRHLIEALGVPPFALLEALGRKAKAKPRWLSWTGAVRKELTKSVARDLIMLLYQLPMEMHANSTWLMNQTTFALLLTMSDGVGRPLLSPMPQGAPSYTMVGRPVVIATQMPDVAPGATPIAVGDWRKAFTIVTRKTPTVAVDPYNAGFCLLYKAEARVGAGTTCPNAARLLRIT